MKQKFPLLPRHIIKQQNGRYRDMKTMEWVSTSQLKKYAPTEAKNDPQSEELKHEHWTNKYYGND